LKRGDIVAKNYISNNIRYLRLKSGIEQSQISELLGKKSTSAVSEWEKGIRVPNVGDLHDLANYFRVSLDDLVKKDLETETLSYNSSNFYNEYKMFPISISAGCLENIDGIDTYDLVTIADEIMGKYAGRKGIIILKVNGESMNKIIPDGAYIVVDTNKTHVTDIKDRDIVVFANSEGYSVKRYINDVKNERFLFKPESLDDTYSDITVEYSESSELKLVGKVVKYIVSLD